MNTCKTCRYWIRYESSEDTYGLCSCTKIDGFNRPSDGLEVQSNHTAVILTGPDFGCIHHETEKNHSHCLMPKRPKKPSTFISCRKLGTPKTVNALEVLLSRYPERTSFGNRNQPRQSLYEIRYTDKVFVCFQ